MKKYSVFPEIGATTSPGIQARLTEIEKTLVAAAPIV